MSKRDELAAVVRGVTKVGPFGPNALEILGRGGKVHLTGTEADALADAVLAWLGEQFDEGLREAVAEALSWSSGDMARYKADAHPDHNRWSWRGRGHGESVREAFRKQADAALGAVRAWVGAK